MRSALNKAHSSLKQLQEIYLACRSNKMFTMNAYDLARIIEIKEEKGVSNVLAVSDGTSVKYQHIHLYTSDFKGGFKYFIDGESDKEVVKNSVLLHEMLHVALGHASSYVKCLSSTLPMWSKKYENKSEKIKNYLDHVELTTAHQLVDRNINNFFAKVPQMYKEYNIKYKKLKELNDTGLMMDYLWENHKEMWDDENGKGDEDGNEGEGKVEIYVMQVSKEEYESAEGIEVVQSDDRQDGKEKGADGKKEDGGEGKEAGNKTVTSGVMFETREVIRNARLERTIRKRMQEAVRLLGASRTKWIASSRASAAPIGHIAKMPHQPKIRVVLDVSGSMVGGKLSGQEIALGIINALPFKRIEVITFNTSICETFRSWKKGQKVYFGGGTSFSCVDHLLDSKTLVITDGYGDIEKLKRSRILVLIDNQEGHKAANIVNINSRG